jgi:hypothetical protein
MLTATHQHALLKKNQEMQNWKESAELPLLPSAGLSLLNSFLDLESKNCFASTEPSKTFLPSAFHHCS